MLLGRLETVRCAVPLLIPVSSVIRAVADSISLGQPESESGAKPMSAPVNSHTKVAGQNGDARHLGTFNVFRKIVCHLFTGNALGEASNHAARTSLNVYVPSSIGVRGVDGIYI